jgi:hypothetical protein
MTSRWGRRFFSFVVVALLGAGVVDAPARAAYQPPTLVCTFADSRINESSGVAAASYRDDLLFTHNDSGDTARFFAVDFTGQTVATYQVAGAGAVDWEDMARGPHSDGTPGQSLYFADIGNNLRDRRYMAIYEVSEPVVGVDGPVLPLRSARRFRYNDIRHDAETLMVHPVTGDVLVVAKEFHGLANVYVLRGDRAVKVATIAVPLLMSRSAKAVQGPLSGTQTTGGDIGPAGDRIVVRTYLEAFEWRLNGTDYAGAFAAKPTRIALPPTGQGEAVAYLRSGDAFLTTSEGVGAPVYRVQSSFAG